MNFLFEYANSFDRDGNYRGLSIKNKETGKVVHLNEASEVHGDDVDDLLSQFGGGDKNSFIHVVSAPSDTTAAADDDDNELSFSVADLDSRWAFGVRTQNATIKGLAKTYADLARKLRNGATRLSLAALKANPGTKSTELLEIINDLRERGGAFRILSGMCNLGHLLANTEGLQPVNTAENFVDIDEVTAMYYLGESESELRKGDIDPEYKVPNTKDVRRTVDRLNREVKGLSPNPKDWVLKDGKMTIHSALAGSAARETQNTERRDEVNIQQVDGIQDGIGTYMVLGPTLKGLSALYTKQKFHGDPDRQGLEVLFHGMKNMPDGSVPKDASKYAKSSAYASVSAKAVDGTGSNAGDFRFSTSFGEQLKDLCSNRQGLIIKNAEGKAVNRQLGAIIAGAGKVVGKKGLLYVPYNQIKDYLDGSYTVVKRSATGKETEIAPLFVFFTTASGGISLNQSGTESGEEMKEGNQSIQKSAADSYENNKADSNNALMAQQDKQYSSPEFIKKFAKVGAELGVEAPKLVGGAKGADPSSVYEDAETARYYFLELLPKISEKFTELNDGVNEYAIERNGGKLVTSGNATSASRGWENNERTASFLASIPVKSITKLIKWLNEFEGTAGSLASNTENLHKGVEAGMYDRAAVVRSFMPQVNPLTMLQAVRDSADAMADNAVFEGMSDTISELYGSLFASAVHPSAISKVLHEMTDDDEMERLRAWYSSCYSHAVLISRGKVGSKAMVTAISRKCDTPEKLGIALDLYMAILHWLNDNEPEIVREMYVLSFVELNKLVSRMGQWVITALGHVIGEPLVKLWNELNSGDDLTDAGSIDQLSEYASEVTAQAKSIADEHDAPEFIIFHAR